MYDFEMKIFRNIKILLAFCIEKCYNKLVNELKGRRAEISYIQSFKRFETKYLLTHEQKAALLEAVGSLLKQDKYGEYSICNLYLDTDDFYFIETSLDKPIYKEKLRIRSYGNVSGQDNVFFEIKKKFDGVVYKRRITIPHSEAESYINDGIKPQSIDGYHANQIFNEIDFLMQKYKPKQKIYLAYDREAYFSPQYPDLRVTFDRNIRSRWEDITLSHDNDTSLLNTGTEDYRLMEIKSSGAIPIGFARILSELKIRPVSFSKYGNIYKARWSKLKEESNEVKT